jgi:hypothetical protein
MMRWPTYGSAWLKSPRASQRDVVTTTQLALVDVLVGLWCVGNVAAAFTLAIHNERPIMLSKLSEIRKAVVAAIGVVLTVLTFVTNNFGGLLPAQWTAVIGSVVAVLTVVATWATPNKPA